MKFSISHLKMLAFKKSLKRSIHTAGTGVLRDWTILLGVVVSALVLLVSLAVYEYVKVVRNVSEIELEGARSTKVYAGLEELEKQVATLRERRKELKDQLATVPVEEKVEQVLVEAVAPSATTSPEVVEDDAVELVE